jgi:hypothetical protein
MDKMKELAELGMLFKNDTLKVHMLLACGRSDDHVFEELQERRMATAEKMEVLAVEVGLK